MPGWVVEDANCFYRQVTHESTNRDALSKNTLKVALLLACCAAPSYPRLGLVFRWLGGSGSAVCVREVRTSLQLMTDTAACQEYLLAASC